MLEHKNYFAVLTAVSVAMTGCGNLVSPTARLGMVKNPDTGLQIGSVVEKSSVTDASFYKNKTIKVRTPNTSGDVAFDLREFTDRLRTAYAAAGYTPTDKDDFGLLVDVNVIYSGQIQTNLADEFAFVGGAAGGIAGARSDARFGTGIGALGGATLGNVIGSFIADGTYIIVARVPVRDTNHCAMLFATARYCYVVARSLLVTAA